MNRWLAVSASAVAVLLMILATFRASPTDMVRQDVRVDQGFTAENLKHWTLEDVEALSGTSLIDLLRHLTDLGAGEDHYIDSTHPLLDYCLSEMVRRGDKRFERAINKIVEYRQRLFLAQIKKLGYAPDHRELVFGHTFSALETSTESETEDDLVLDADVEDIDAALEAEMQFQRVSKNLELVTALRRLQQLPDPVQVFVNEVNPEYLDWPDKPTLRICIRNIDTQQQEVGFQDGGDYRSGRLSRIRIQVRDVKTGSLVPVRGRFSFIGGGQVVRRSRPTLMFGEGWNTELRVEDYVQEILPGNYSVEVLYHNSHRIADDEQIDGLICCRSKPFALTIGEREIRLLEDERHGFRPLLASIDRTVSPVVIDGSRYGPWAYEIVPPESPPGQVLTAGWDAVPDLLDELQLNSKNVRSTAHTLAMLYSITGLVDPTPTSFFGGRDSSATGALGPYEFVSRGWGVWYHFDTEPGGGGFGLGRHDVVGDNEPMVFDAEAAELQRELVSEWERLRDRSHVKYVKPNEGRGVNFEPGFPF